MARPIEIPNIDDLLRRYQAGEAVLKLAREIGIDHHILRNRFIKMGVPLRGRSDVTPLRVQNGPRIKVPDFQSFIDRYVSGETEQALAAEAGISRGAFRLRLKNAGVQPRGISESIKRRWSRASAAERSAMLDNAHAAARGRKHTIAEMRLRADTNERNMQRVSAIEVALGEMLIARNIVFTPQKAEFIYNIDLAIEEPRIAVEVFGGAWHSGGRHARRFHKRTKYILDRGWNVVIVWHDSVRYPIGIGCAEYIAAFVQELRSNPSLVRQYRVITGDGKLSAVRKSRFNTPTDIKRLRCGDYATRKRDSVSG